ncbi:hypothetical protein PMAYCL1PPCAC_26804, partial [Pristionchus mayeri]
SCKAMGGQHQLHNEINVMMMEEEAARCGITGEEYFRVCMEQNFILSEQEWKEWNSEGSVTRNQEIFADANSSEEVMGILKQHNPKQYAIILKREDLYQKYRDRLDAESHQFL